jgi:hypothetical protein
VNPSQFGEIVNFTAQVTSTTLQIPQGSVSFYDGAALLATVLLDSSGVSNLSISTLTTGSHGIVAVYNPILNFNSSSSSLTQVVNQATTDTQIVTSSPNPSKEGDPVTFFVSTTSLLGIPSGSVTLKDGSQLLGTATLVNGVAIFTTSSLAMGSHQITAVYSGNLNFGASTSAPYTQVVGTPAEINTNITVASSNNPSEFGESVTFTAHVNSSLGVPTGIVTFFDGSSSIGEALLIKGIATISTSALSIGEHPIIGFYNGDTSFSSSISNTLIQIVNPSTIPVAPQNFKGYQVSNRFADSTDLVNVLSWDPPSTGPAVVRYKIYRDAKLTRHIGTVSSRDCLQFEDHNRKKNRNYTYYIVSVNELGQTSSAVSTSIGEARDKCSNTNKRK